MPHDWGLGGYLKGALGPLWRCARCGTWWTAGYDQYQADYYDPRPLAPDLVAALSAPARVAAVHALLRCKPPPPQALLLALLDTEIPALKLDATMRRRLARLAGVDRERAEPRPASRPARDLPPVGEVAALASDVTELLLGRAPNAKRLRALFDLLHALDAPGKHDPADRELRARLVALLEQLLASGPIPAELRAETERWIDARGHRPR
jgi:hypothetical protein